MSKRLSALTFVAVFSVAAAFLWLPRKSTPAPIYFRDDEGILQPPLSDYAGVYVWYEPKLDVLIVVDSGDERGTRSDFLTSMNSYVIVKAGRDDSNLFVGFHVDRTTKHKLLWVSRDLKPQWIDLPVGAGKEIYARLERPSFMRQPLMPIIKAECQSQGIRLPIATGVE